MRRMALFALASILAAAPAAAQITFSSEPHYAAQQNNTALGGGQWRTLNLDGTVTGAISGSTLSLSLGGLDAADIANAAAINSNATITGAWTVTTGQLIIGDGSATTRVVKWNANGGVDPTLGVVDSIEGYLYSATPLALSDCTADDCSTHSLATGLFFYSGSTAVGSWLYAPSTETFMATSDSTAAAVLATRTDTNYAATNVKVTTTEVTCPTSGTTCTASNAIPAGCFLVGVSSRITQAGNGTCTSYDIGDGTTANLWSNDTATVLGTTTTNANFNAGTAAASKVYPAAASITVTCNGGTFGATAAMVRFGVHCLDATAPGA